MQFRSLFESDAMLLRKKVKMCAFVLEPSSLWRKLQVHVSTPDSFFYNSIFDEKGTINIWTNVILQIKFIAFKVITFIEMAYFCRDKIYLVS